MALVHGGQLAQIAREYDIPEAQWLDLSTGIAPFCYPIPDIPQHIWQQLPQANEALLLEAKQYYLCSHLLISNGSQGIIKSLPSLWHQQSPHSRHVYLPFYGYKEHALAWDNANFEIHWYLDELPDISQLPAHCVLVVINPNNPTGKLFDVGIIRQYQEVIDELKGLLVIDEAFMDVITPSQSIATDIGKTNTLVLRSFGKFFGLAGIRIGFLIANKHWLTLFSEHLGPWQVNGPAQIIAQHALADLAWQSRQRQQLRVQRQWLKKLLRLHFSHEDEVKVFGTDLFQTVDLSSNNNASKIYHSLCQQGVYVRLTDDKQGLRFGIPKPEDMMRLSDALKSTLSKSVHP